MARKKTKLRKPKARKSTPAKAKRKAKARKPVAKKSVARRKHRVRGRAEAGELVSYESRGRGGRSGGQAGDTQGISARPDADSESVEELLEEGQSFEAELLNGVERAADPDESEVQVHEVPEDDVPEEYRKNRENED
ncbi:MAG TPA: hypothetical protein VMH31_17885 [Methylomirabilota bacterium]|nr:hypothetical protein [Methylomirabilota bacterium]